ncbi:MAG TPA: FeoA family protein [Vicinamibacterales bacterium]|nr:FeoA family protein [Vicinamibacterales bacterium]
MSVQLVPSTSSRVATARPVRLSDLAAGRTARMHAATLTPQDCALIRALGLTDRCLMRICKVGEPCIVQVHATRIGLSRTVADGILVVPESQG